MRNARLWRSLLGVEKTVIETMEMDDDGVLVFSVRATGSMRHRCGRCQRRCPRYDLGGGRRRWRSLDSGSVRVELEADSPRVSCRIHGVSVVAVPWARHGSGHTHHFDAQVAWLATQTSKTAITQLMRISVAHGRGDHHPGLGRYRETARPVRRPDPDRDRRDFL